MEVILLEKIRNLGQLGEKVNVKSGYGRNFLIPKGKAVVATPENIEKFEHKRADLEHLAAQTLAVATERKAKIEALASITIISNAGPEGKLFGSVGNYDVAETLKKAGIEIEKREVRMPLGPIQMIGEYDIEIHLHTDVNVSIKVIVESE
jgi:large subunit ribosomal protein L9